MPVTTIRLIMSFSAANISSEGGHPAPMIPNQRRRKHVTGILAEPFMRIQSARVFITTCFCGSYLATHFPQFPLPPGPVKTRFLNVMAETTAPKFSKKPTLLNCETPPFSPEVVICGNIQISHSNLRIADHIILHCHQMCKRVAQVLCFSTFCRGLVLKQERHDFRYLDVSRSRYWSGWLHFIDHLASGVWYVVSQGFLDNKVRWMSDMMMLQSRLPEKWKMESL